MPSIPRAIRPFRAFLLLTAGLALAACQKGPPRPVSGTAELTSPATGYVYIKNRVSDLCLGVRGVDSHGPGTDAEVYTCQPGGNDPGLDNQWHIELADADFVLIKNRVSNLCLGVRAVDSHGPGTGVEVYTCDPGGADKGQDNRWRRTRIPDSDFWYFRNKVSNLCLGVRGIDHHGPGEGAEVYTCVPGGNDPGLDNEWRIVPVPDTDKTDSHGCHANAPWCACTQQCAASGWCQKQRDLNHCVGSDGNQ